MLATVRSAVIRGVHGHPVTVEVLVTDGLPAFTIVGLPDPTCRESRDRVRAAILATGRKWPNARVTVNLAPSGFRKAGAGLDVAVALGVLAASGQLDDEARAAVGSRAVLGELGLDGSLRCVAGLLPMAAALGAGEVVVPAPCGPEAALVPGVVARPVTDLGQLLAVLAGDMPWPDAARAAPAPPAAATPDLADVRGQPLACLALEVAAAGGHHLLLSGPPGAGKTMLAERLPGILPPLSEDDALEVTAIHSAAGLPMEGRLHRRPPFRGPHHTASLVAMVGGGTAVLRPGEASLAHRGVLFLDEMGEFPATVLDGLRQPLESGEIHLARAHGSAVLPAAFLLVGATNPCPCGYAPTLRCDCTEPAIQRYRRRFSGPLLDRFDLRVVLTAPDRAGLADGPSAEASTVVAARVAEARQRARARGVSCNAQLAPAALDGHTRWSPGARRLLEEAVDAGRLSGRGLHRVRGVALTLHDLRGGGPALDAEEVALALALRADLERRPGRWEVA